MLKKLRNIFSITTMKRRMRTAFMSIILLLFFAGAMSLFELERVSHDTEEILLASKENVDLANDMFKALHSQNNTMMHMAIAGGSIGDIGRHSESCNASIEALSGAVRMAEERMSKTDNPTFTDSLILCTNRINELAKSYLNGDVHRSIAEALALNEESTYTTSTWYASVYYTEYENVSNQISKYMTGSESTLGPDVNRLSHTARRAVTPVFISLVVMLVVVIMFYYFMRTYFIHPVQRINRSLGDYLAYKLPFDENIPSRDEIATLRDRIATLISKFR